MKPWLKLLIASLLIKIIYLLFAIVIRGDMSFCSYSGYTSIIKANDSWWYEKVANNGYPVAHDRKEIGSSGPEWKQSEWAFFPMYPLINKLLMTTFSISYDDSAFIYSIVLSYLALLGFYKMCEIYSANKRKSFYISLLFLISPFHYYYSMMYTEALFFSLLIFSFILIHNKKYVWLPLLLIPLAITRPNGLIVLLPLYLYYLEEENILSVKHVDFHRLFSQRNIVNTLLFATGAFSFAFYCLYQYKMTGYFNAFSIAQAGWEKSLTMPWNAFFRSGELHVQFGSIYVILIAIYTACIFRKIPLSWNILIWISLIFPLLGGRMLSMPRFISILFPLTIVFGVQLFALQKFKLNYILLFCLFVMQLWSFSYWVNNHPFSY